MDKMLKHLPAIFRASGIAAAGPIPMTSGGTPVTANARRVPRIGSPLLSASARLATRTAAAPSLV